MEEFKKQLNKTAYQLIKKADKRQQKGNKQVLYRAALLSVYGWQMAIPVLLGIVLGILLDKVFPITHFSWILNLILLGFVIGFYNATQWMKKNLGLKGKKDAKH
ncbi:MAG: AtpZ/AtpI family protein [Alphaproteobacteria bacterium]|nr:AtpZ/AtpI family protein [Alphaproteobacteria bacterium]